MRATVVSGNMQNLRALTLDPRMGLMFWTDWEESNPRIERATLAGQDRRVIFRVLDIDNGGWPNGLTIDFISERLYWIDAKSDSVHTILYDGGDHREVLRDSALLTHPFAVSLFDSYVYWTDWRVNAIIRANKWNGTDVQIIEGTSAQPFDLKIIHPSRQPFSSKNPCRKNGRCSHICLINSTTTRLCACPHMMRLSPDNQTCLVVNQTLVYATPTNIVAMDILPPHTRLFPVLAGKSVEKVQALDFDAEEKIVYWADANSATIARVYLNGSGNVEVIVKSDLQNPNGIAVDWLSDNVYFTSWSEGDGMASISIASENGHYRRVLLNEKNGLQKPRDIVVDPQSGMMYWFDTINGSASLYQSFMDGTVMKKMSPSSESMADPRGLLLDVIHKRLLWIEQKSKTIFAFDIVSKNTRKITFVDKTAKPSLMTLDMANSQIIIYDDSEAGNSKISSSPLSDAFVADAQLQLIKNVSGVVLLKALDHELQGGDNACRIRPSPCSHHCVPLPDQGHRCLCAEGFDFVSGLCQPINSFLLYADDDSLEAISILATHDLDQLSSIPRVNRPIAVAVDARREWIYWIDGESNELWKVKRDSTQSQLVLSGQNSKLAHIAVDWATGNVYLSSRVPGKTAIGVIEVVLSDNRKYTVVEEKRDVPRHLQVDSHNGYLFWLTSVGLHRSNLDGSNMKTLITSANLTDLALNLPDERLCFIEGNKTTLECTNYDGLNQRQAMDFSAIINAVTAIAVHGMQIFWYDRAMQGGSLLAGNLTSDGSLPNYLRMRRHRMNANVFDMTIYDKDSHITTNLCSNDNGGCQDICFFYPDNRMKCACVFGQLAADGKTCEAYKAFLAYSRGRMIEFAPMTASSGGTGSANPAYPPIDSTEVIRSAVGVSFDYAQSLIFYSDIQLKRIVAVKFDGSDNFAVAENVGSVEGLAFDYLHKELYFTSYSNHSIMRVSVADPYTVAGNYPKATTRLLMLNDQDKPRGIAVDPCEMRIYWTNWREGLPSIERAYFSGFQREKLITTDIRTPNAITIDFLARKLYWSDARLDKIERCEMDGSNRQVLVSGDTIVGHYPAHPFGLVVYGNYLFYTDWITRGVVKMNKLTGGEAEFLRGNFTEQPMGVAAIAEDALQCGMDACTRANLGCQDVCRLTAAGQPHCACTGERTLSHDNRTCEEMAARCADVEYECTTTGRCIPYEETCDGVPDCPNKEDEAIDFCGTRECREGFFACGNGQCILAAKKCDGHNDCGNYRDETQCECRPGEFKCKSGMCVLLTKRCNNEMDCNDASDEMDNCAKRDCSKVEILKGKTSVNCAKTTQCIVSDWLCDGQNDCWDNSDEKNCTTIQRTRPTSGRPSVCSQWQHKCKSTGTCIPKSWACDQQRDCADGSDEENCERSCLQDEFECAASKNCIDLQLKCDGKKDCKDGSDEKDCPNDCDVAKSFKCRGNGRCIPKQWQCDGFDDCMDNSGSSALGSDEQNCDAVSIDFVIGCRADEFRCNSTHECIPRKNFCDGDKDCTDGSDEPPNCGKRYCPNSDFSCGDGQCIPISWICNQIPDCRDGSDEQETLCSGKGSCKNGQFLCDNGVCINETLTCDQKNDCGDRSDENRCNVNECMTDDPCDGVCIDKKIGFECLCDSPRKKLKKSSSGKMECLWANMCDDFPCSQFCMNKGENGFHCFCEEGYTLAPDQRTCRHTDSVQPLLLVANRHYLRLYTLKGRPKGILLSNLTNGVAVDYDYTSQRVYWSDVTLTSSHIGYTSLGNVPDTYKVIHPLPRENPDGVAVDWLAKNLYWCDKNNDAISVSTLDGRFRKTLLKGAPLQEPRAVVLDPIR
uniref:EGF-like domain-containing protein n=1 Tax=Plectus sambesii TaxID=2011161 RepID=A0A914WJQ4_9BILA